MDSVCWCSVLFFFFFNFDYCNWRFAFSPAPFPQCVLYQHISIMSLLAPLLLLCHFVFLSELETFKVASVPILALVFFFLNPFFFFLFLLPPLWNTDGKVKAVWPNLAPPTPPLYVPVRSNLNQLPLCVTVSSTNEERARRLVSRRSQGAKKEPSALSRSLCLSRSGSEPKRLLPTFVSLLLFFFCFF